MQRLRSLLLATACLIAAGCSWFSVPYRAVKGTVQGGVWVATKTYQVTAGTTKIVYKIGEFTFEVVKAPIGWALTHEEIESMDGLPVKEAIRQDRVKVAPYVVKGRRYAPISVEQAQAYQEEGLASWYGYESGRMTANGEAFNPEELTAAHKTLPIPMFAQVTNLENGKSLIVRVNDRGPFPPSGGRILDLSAGAAKRLGFYEKGVTKVRVQALRVTED